MQTRRRGAVFTLTDGVALPAPTALAKAGAVHHVALFVALVKRLVHVVRLLIHDALICGTWRAVVSPGGGRATDYIHSVSLRF